MTHSMYQTFLIQFLVLVISGCAHSPLPSVTEEFKEIQVSEEESECKSDTSCLQIFIMYGELGCSHAALRVEVTSDKTVFWDPAGGYGIAGSVDAIRLKDLVIDPVPTVGEYLEFRNEVPTEAAEIFEFVLERSDADYLYGVLKQSNTETLYDTQGIGLFCSYHISEFLEKFAARILSVKQVFLPHSLAEQLYQQQPERVLIVRFSKAGYVISVVRDKTD